MCENIELISRLYITVGILLIPLCHVSIEKWCRKLLITPVDPVFNIYIIMKNETFARYVSFKYLNEFKCLTSMNEFETTPCINTSGVYTCVAPHLTFIIECPHHT